MTTSAVPTGIYALTRAELASGALSVQRARECLQVTVELYGAGDGQAIGYARAIADHLAASR